MIGLVFGFLAGWLIKSPQTEVITEVDVVEKYLTVEVPVEVMPDFNCPYELIRTPKTNGELLLSYKRLIDWRANCLNSIREASGL